MALDNLRESESDDEMAAAMGRTGTYAALGVLALIVVVVIGIWWLVAG